MSKNVTIPLAEPITGHRGLISAIILRPPTWGDVMGTGSPYTIHSDAEGRPFLVYDEVVIGKYAEALVVEPDPLLLEKVGLAETLQVREAIVDFFLAAAAVGGGSKTSPKTSASNSDGSPTPSAA